MASRGVKPNTQQLSFDFSPTPFVGRVMYRRLMYWPHLEMRNKGLGRRPGEWMPVYRPGGFDLGKTYAIGWKRIKKWNDGGGEKACH